MGSPTVQPPASSFIIPRLDDTEQRLLWKIATYLATGLGVSGVIQASGTKTGRFGIFHALTDSSVTLVYKDGTTATVAVLAGDRVYGDIVSATLVSGSGELYKIAA